MPHVLLLGAGFTRNWGGWLATEAFEYLLGCPEVVESRELVKLLWQHQAAGGFEGALADLQAAIGANNNRELFGRLQSAVSAMFRDMNRGCTSRPDWEFQNGDRRRQVGEFLSRFDQIFSLNQDTFLEHHYCGNRVSQLADSRQWAGTYLPGVRIVQRAEGMDGDSWAKATWAPCDEKEFQLDARSQPLIKLHGSSNWRHADGGELLVMGGGKDNAIDKVPLLRWYRALLLEAVTAANARLMVIGYGFRDSHINDAIRRGVDNGLQLFVIAPEGANIARAANPTDRAPIRVSTAEEEFVQRSLIGASRRPLSSTFGGDVAEHDKVMRFFGG